MKVVKPPGKSPQLCKCVELILLEKLCRLSLNNLLQEEGLYIIGKDFAKATALLGDILVKPF